MRLNALTFLPLLALPHVHASLATDPAGKAVSWANSFLSSSADDVQQSKKGEVHTMDSWSYVDCGLPTDIVQLRTLSVFPDPPVPGKNLTIHVEGDVQEVIEEGANADVVVKLGLIKLLQKTFDLCDEARGANATVQCPVQPGTYSVIQTVELPKEIPKAKFAVNVRGYTVDDADLICLDLYIDFMKKPGSGQ